MVAGNRLAAEKREEDEVLRRQFGAEGDDSHLRVPTEMPPFTLKQLKNTIPPHCFQRSALRSSAYLAHDVLIAGGLFYLAVSVLPAIPSPYHLIAWPLYWAAQGCMFMAIWIIAHECGHHAFSNSPILDDVIGLVLHSLLLAPYFSWKYSHRRHHSNTGSLDWDEVYVPKQRSTIHWFSPYLNNPPGRILSLTITLAFGWYLYLIFNSYGRHYDHYASHFDPYSPIYRDGERAKIFITDISILAVIYLLYRLAASFTLSWVLCVYGAPLAVANAWLVIITFLHHAHTALPRYDSTEWDWLRGALTTVDRDYGILNRVFHHITDTHIAHHLFSTIPHYHAMEATKAIRPVLGKYYRSDDTPIAKSLWRETAECIFVKPDDGHGTNKGVFSGAKPEKNYKVGKKKCFR